MQTIITGQFHKELITTITQRGQVTIPAEIRRLLGTKPRDKVSFRVENGQVHLLPARFTLATVYGSVKAKKATTDLIKASVQAKEDKVLENLDILKGT